MKTRLTQKQEVFCLKYFESGNAAEAARLANYSPQTADVIGRENLRKLTIQARLRELREKAGLTEDVSIASVHERKQILTVIGRARLTDFMTAGADGSWVDIGPENPNSRALQEITSRTEYDDKSADAAVITKIRLHDPVRAIDLLNKMDKIYQDGATVNIDNRHLEIIVRSENTKELLEEIAQGIEPHTVADD